eukprot:TRINITY_DN5922_c0_g1_i1.p2 TRINITY_DN5922_c0_g1~~TRINITY_DN5922_c0_g1_i1.p2  ORF type:complete len:81 (+),score=38.85 TRINITY_DN5922_c0_g1_i1:265-507(+)
MCIGVFIVSDFDSLIRDRISGLSTWGAYRNWKSVCNTKRLNFAQMKLFKYLEDEAILEVEKRKSTELRGRSSETAKAHRG